MENCVEETSKLAYGVSSQTREGHVIFWDFDGTDLKAVEDYLRTTQEEHGLSTVYIIRSSHGYNAMCLDITTLGFIKDLGGDIRFPGDRQFYLHNAKRGYFTLRFGSDKELIKLLSASGGRYTKSNAHRLFLQWYFRHPIRRNKNFNNETTWYMIAYESEKNGEHQVVKRTSRYGETVIQ